MAEGTTKKMGPVRIALNVAGAIFLAYIAWVFVGPRFIPKAIVDESFQLSSGEMKAYTFSVQRSATVDVEVSSQPNGTDVVCMHQRDLPAFEKAVKGAGGTYNYLQGMSGQQVIRQHLSGQVAEGSYACLAHNAIKTGDVLGVLSNAIRAKYQPKPPNTVSFTISIKG